MNHIIAFLSILALLLTSCKKDSDDMSMDGKIEHLIKSHIIFGRTPGVAVGTFHNGEENLFFFGTKDLSTGEKIDEFTMFEIGSITKTFSALLFADHVIKNEMSLSDTIDGYFPSNVQVPVRDGKHIQFIHLLNHTSGLPREPDLPNQQAFESFTETDLAKYLNTLELNSTPGSAYVYSNLGMGLIGYLLQKTSGESYCEQLSNTIFSPFGMMFTKCEKADFITNNIAQGYYGNTPVEFYGWSNIFAAAGIIKSNLHDMMMYLKENIDYNNSVLRDALMLTKEITFQVDEHLYLGLGWHLIIDGDGDEIYWHNGGTAGFSTFIGYNSTTKDGVVVLINSYCFGEQNVIGIETLNILKGYQ